MTERIDAHVHLWNRTTDPQDWIDPATMEAIARDFHQGLIHLPAGDDEEEAGAA